VSIQAPSEAQVPPQNLDAEEYVLGAILRAGAEGLEASRATVEAIRATGLGAEEFYYAQSHGPIYEAALALADEGLPTDAVSVVAELERRGQLESVKGTVRVHELAVLCPAVSNAPHHARLIREAADRREERSVGQALTDAAWNGGVTAHPELAERVRKVLEGRPSARCLDGLTHAEVLASEIPEVGELVEGIIDVGTVGAIVGLPYARKSWTGQELARKVANGSGLFLGKYPVLIGGPVVYCWQDDSTAKMLARVQARADAPGLPIRWFLNEGIRLPADLSALRKIVERDEAVLVVFDSLYNFLPVDIKLKDEDVAPIIAALKSELCDRTGATVAVIDHAPWPSEANRGQRRAYGSVFKTAAVRWHIHLETDGKDDTRLHAEAKGNNVAGFPRTPAYWDEEACEIRLLEPDHLAADELDAIVLAHVAEYPGNATTKIAAGVGKRRENVAKSLERLGTRQQVKSKTARDLGKPGTGNYWFPADHAESEPSGDDGTAWDGSPGLFPFEDEPSDPSHPRRGDGS